jgi:DNA repair protein RadA/Sms
VAKRETIFVCESCGNESIAWAGRCPVCGNWNTYRELKHAKQFGRVSRSEPTEPPQLLSQVKTADFSRLTTGIGEFDRVLGGGIVPGSVILLGGDPGIGKSTLILQVASALGKKEKSGAIFYVSGEESREQIKIRADRLHVTGTSIYLFSETDVEAVVAAAKTHTPRLIIIDSIQTMYDQSFPSTPGSIVQVRESALRLQQYAKQARVSLIMIGHVTKEGGVAGPRTLEHLVDVVLYLEGERYQGTRILRGEKNRFGATEEIGVFQMEEGGLVEVANPSKIFLAERKPHIPGSVVTCILEGTRPFLVEVQALVSPTVFGYPQRKASGFDLNRLQLILAVLTRRAGLKLLTKDVFVNIVGGVKVAEPAADLAVALAIASAERNAPIHPKMVAVGELGLTGEIRPVSQLNKRLTEAKRLGFTQMVTAASIDEAVAKTAGL